MRIATIFGQAEDLGRLVVRDSYGVVTASILAHAVDLCWLVVRDSDNFGVVVVVSVTRGSSEHVLGGRRDHWSSRDDPRWGRGRQRDGHGDVVASEPPGIGVVAGFGSNAKSSDVVVFVIVHVEKLLQHLRIEKESFEHKPYLRRVNVKEHISIVGRK